MRKYVIVSLITTVLVLVSSTCKKQPLSPEAVDYTVTDIDGKVYQTVQIGDQIWMAENLAVTHYADGSSIPLLEDSASWDALLPTSEAYCWYDNSAVNRDIYGGLYSWAAAMNGWPSSDASPSGVQGVCPDGWHLPSDTEWAQLINYLDGTMFAGGKLKAKTGWEPPNEGATNESGFTALPGGFRTGTGWFGYLGVRAYFWCTSEATDEFAWRHRLENEDAGLLRYEHSKRGGLSVRCVKD